jgi:flagellar biosynthesis GTPase FlhF
MAKTKLDKIATIEEEMKQLAAERSKLLQQHREQEKKARTNRLCKRGGLLEKMLPDTIPLTDEQFQAFMEKTMLTPFTRRALDEVTAQGTTPPAAAALPNQLKLDGNGEGAENGETARVSG